MKKLFLLLALIATVSFNACKDDEPTTVGPTPTASTYQPTHKNSWRIFDNFETDSLGAMIPGTTFSSTLSAGDSFQYNGKTATNFININTEGEKDTTILSVYGKTVYMDGKVFEDFGDMTNILGENAPKIPLNLTWVKIADANSNSWEVSKVPFTNIDVSSMSGGIPATMNGNNTMTGYKKGTAVVNIKGTNYTAQEFNIETKLTGTVKSFNIDAASVVYTNTQRFWFVEGVGMVKFEIAPTTYEIKYSPLAKQMSSDLEDMKMVSGGNVSTVIDFNIK